MAKYDPLNLFLASTDDVVVTLSFAEIERLLGDMLPASARKHAAWWANETDGNHVEARAWLDAGFRTQNLDLNAQIVEFVKD